MSSIHLDMTQTLAVAAEVFFLGFKIKQHVKNLQKEV